MNPLLTRTLGALAALTLPAAATLRLNEVHSNPPGTDAGYEYIEIISTTGGVESLAGHKLMLLDCDGGDVGRCDGYWNLNSFSTGANGLLLLGVNYDVEPKGGPWAGKTAAGTAFGSIAVPAGKDGLIEPNRAWMLILVKDFAGVPIVGTTDYSSTDTQLNSGIRTALQDAVALNEYMFVASDNPPPTPCANLSKGSYSAGNVSRLSLNTTANSTAAWFGGTIVGTTGTSVTFDPVQRFGTQANPVATPGAVNTPPSQADIRINEVGVDPAGSDDNYEYIELLKVGGEATNAQGYHLLVINTDPNSDTSCGTDRSVGVIVEAWNLDEVQFGSNNLALIGQNYNDGYSPWRDYVAPATVLSDIGTSTDADAIKLSNDNIGNEIWTKTAGVCGLDRTNNGFTLLLVKGFTGTPLQDLDANNDGILDATPWTSIVDSVGYDGNSATYATANVTQAGYLPDNISRKVGNTTANSAAAFYGGAMHASSRTNLEISGSQFFGGFRGQATPGRVNLSAAPTTPAPLKISEVNFDPASDSEEFIELASDGADAIASTRGYSLLIVSTASANRGAVLNSYDLSGFSTGANGLLLFGQNFATTASTLFPAGTLRLDTAVESGPPGFTAGQLPDADFAVLLVTGLSGSPPADIDANNDGSIDAGLPFTIVDGVSLGTLQNAAVTNLPALPSVDNISRIPGTSTWYGGQITSGLSFSSSAILGPWQGSVTPGQRNHIAPPAASSLLINEANVNPPGTDSNYDYVELLATSLKAQSMNGLTLLVVDTSAGDTGTGNIGTITRVWDLDSLATGSNGLLLLGDGYTQNPLGGPFAAVKSSLTAVGDPVGMGSDALSSNDGIALLLVRGFSGHLGQDLDETDNQILDATPWTQLVDSLAFGTTAYGFPDMMSGITFTPDNLSRGSRTADFTPSNVNAWYGGDFAGTTGDSTDFDPAKQFDNTDAVANLGSTPGNHNYGGNPEDEVDNDLDGQVNLLEQAFGTDKNSATSIKFPKSSLVQVSGQNYLGYSFSRRKGGTGTAADYTASGVRYLVEMSSDLASWSPAGANVVQVSVVDDGNGTTETITIRLTTAPSPSALKSFLRLRTIRL